ncbi:hypothetical protein VZT92_000170 [Zoarces viviparus]|uniref:Uncharacterized protein n=1 Tax=Zoarces viviparus TaxID=48416 RepID=A0AAW1G6U0_ZOAVI
MADSLLATLDIEQVFEGKLCRCSASSVSLQCGWWIQLNGTRSTSVHAHKTSLCSSDQNPPANLHRSPDQNPPANLHRSPDQNLVRTTGRPQADTHIE